MKEKLTPPRLNGKPTLSVVRIPEMIYQWKDTLIEYIDGPHTNLNFCIDDILDSNKQKY